VYLLNKKLYATVSNTTDGIEVTAGDEKFKVTESDIVSKITLMVKLAESIQAMECHVNLPLLEELNRELSLLRGEETSVRCFTVGREITEEEKLSTNMDIHHEDALFCTTEKTSEFYFDPESSKRGMTLSKDNRML
jgi:hypothetical protein